MGVRVPSIPEKFAGSHAVWFGDCVLDLGAHRLLRDGVVFPLDPKAVAVLLCLAADAPNLVTTEDLLARVWKGVVVGDNSAQQVVRRLRAALGDSSRSPRFIETLHRRGYRLLVEPRLESRRADARDVPGPAQAATVLLAILPFVDRSVESTDPYISEGLALEIGSQLAKVPAVRVISRDAIAAAVSAGTPLTVLGQALGASKVVEGFVRAQDGQVRVIVQLNEVDSGQQVWSATFDRPLTGLLSLHSDIAAAVVRALGAGFAESDAGAWLDAGTADATALGLFHKAAAYLATAGSDNRIAIELLEIALERDPCYVEARSALAWRYCWSARSGRAGSHALAREHAVRALADSGACASAHYAMGAVLLLDHRQEAAIRELRQAVELNRSHRRALEDLSVLCSLTGELDQSLELALCAAEVGAGDANSCWHVAVPLMALGEFDRVRRLLSCVCIQRRDDRVLYRCAAALMLVDALGGLESSALLQSRTLLDQARSGHLLELALAGLDVQRMFGCRELLADLEYWHCVAPEARSALALSPLSVRSRLAQALLQAGATARAQELLEQGAAGCVAQIAAGSDSVRHLVEMAAISALRGDRKAALGWLGGAYDSGYVRYREIDAEPSFVSLARDRRWVSLMASMRAKTMRMCFSAGSQGLLRQVDVLVQAMAARSQA